MISRQDAELDLAWFFTEADGAAGGLKSTSGQQIERLKKGARRNSGDGSAQGMTVKGSRSYMSPDDAIERMDGRKEHIVRAREVYQRLAQLTAEQRSSLRIAFECVEPFHGVPIDLVAHQPSVQRAYRRHIESTERAIHSAAKKPKLKERERRFLGTPRAWLLQVELNANKPGGDVAREQLEREIENAKAALDGAVSAYCRTEYPVKERIESMTQVRRTLPNRYDALANYNDTLAMEARERGRRQRAEAAEREMQRAASLASAEKEHAMREQMTECRGLFWEKLGGLSPHDLAWSGYEIGMSWVVGDRMIHQDFGHGVVVEVRTIPKGLTVSGPASLGREDLKMLVRVIFEDGSDRMLA